VRERSSGNNVKSAPNGWCSIFHGVILFLTLRRLHERSRRSMNFHNLFMASLSVIRAEELGEPISTLRMLNFIQGNPRLN
jgi:hypothetical protein